MRSVTSSWVRHCYMYGINDFQNTLMGIIRVENSFYIFIFQDSLINGKFKRTVFI